MPFRMTGLMSEIDEVVKASHQNYLFRRFSQVKYEVNFLINLD